MPPTLRLCVCFYLLAACSAKPTNWHQGDVVMKDLGLPPAPLVHPEYLNEAQFAAAQNIKNAGENAQIHLAILKKKYMDIVRQQFYNHFATVPYIKERQDQFQQNQHGGDILPMKIVPAQPLFIHHPAGSNPCSGNILNCLHANIQSTLEKIAPPSSIGLQPCFGPYCNPMGNPKPSHTSFLNRKPSNHPHRICDGKRPDQNCYQRTTLWPTYATLKFNTKLYPVITTVSPKDISHHGGLPPLQTLAEDHLTKNTQQHFMLPGKFFNLATKPTSFNSKADEKFDIETLKINTTKLENEMLGIPEDELSKIKTESFVTASTVIQTLPETKNKVLTEPVSSTLTVPHLNTDKSKNINNETPSTSETTEYSLELKENSQNIPSFNTKTTLIQPTSKYSFHTNDVLETSTPETPKSTIVTLKSFEEVKKLTTSSTPFQTTPKVVESLNEEHTNLEMKSGPNEQYEISTIESMSMATKNTVLESTISSNMEDLEDAVVNTVAVNKEYYDRTTESNNFDNRMEEKNQEYSTTEEASFAGYKKLESETTTVDQNPEWKNEFELMTTEKLLDENLPTSRLNPAATKYFSEDPTQRKTIWEENGDFLYTTMNNNKEYITRMLDGNLAETTSAETPALQTPEPMFENAQEQREFPTQSTFRTVEELTESTLKYYTDQEQENKNIDTIVSETERNSDIETRTEELITTNILMGSSDSFKFFEETTTGSDSDYFARSEESIFFTTKNPVIPNIITHEGTEYNQEAKEEIFTESSKTEPFYTSIYNDNFQPTQSVLENIEALTQTPVAKKSEVDGRTSEYSTDTTKLNSVEADLENEVYNHHNGADGPSLITGENVLETRTIQESGSDMPTRYVPTFSVPSFESQTDSSYSQETSEGKVSKINWGDEQDNIFKSAIKHTEEWTTEILDTTEYSLLGREEPFHNYDYPLYNLEETTLDQTLSADTESPFTKSSIETDGIAHGQTITSFDKSIEVTTDTITTGLPFTDLREYVTHSPSVTENEQLFSTLNYGSEGSMLDKEDQTPGTSTSHISIDDREDITPENNSNGLPQLREADEGESHEMTIYLVSTSEPLKNWEPTNKQEEQTTLLATTENTHKESTQDINVTQLTEVSELRENIDEYSTVSITPTKDYTETETVPTTLELDKVTAKSRLSVTEEKYFESNLISPELFGKTDTPGLLISGDWTEDQTEEVSLNSLKELFTLEESTPAEFLQSKVEDEGNFSYSYPSFSVSDIPGSDINEGTEIISTNLVESTKILETFTLHNREPDSHENSGLSAIENNEETTTDNSNVNGSPHSYQNGVLKFTSEIETRTGDGLSTEVTEPSTNPGSDVELNDGSNRKVRSVHHDKEATYPTTECILCLLGLPHGQRIKRSSENRSNNNVKENNNSDSETKVLQDGKSRNSNSSYSTNLNLEDPENSSLYASTILELLPVIKDGYRNNAFSEDDKKVIRSLFGDMKTLVDEGNLERITESTGDLLMGDGASRIDEVIEDVDYDSYEGSIDVMSEEERRLKRSMKHSQIMDELLKQIPSNLKSQNNIPSQLETSRMIRSTQVTQAEASAILALLAEKGEAVQLDIPDDEDDDEYEYYEDEGDDYGDEDSGYADVYEDDYDKPSFGELIKLARKHRERKARAEQS